MNTALQYPEISFWDTSAPGILFINPKEFRREDHLKMIGLQDHPLRYTFGCAKRDEVLRRQKNVKFLTEYPGIHAHVEMLSMELNLPNESTSFMTSFANRQDGHHWQFWKNINRFQSAIAQITSAGETVPEDVLQLADFLRNTATSFKTKELGMSQTVADRLLTAVAFGGTVEYCIGVRESHCHHSNRDNHSMNTEYFGFRPFSQKPAPSIPPEPKYHGMGKIRKRIAQSVHGVVMWNYRRKVKKWAKPLILKTFPDKVGEAIEGFITRNFCSRSPFSEDFTALMEKTPHLSQKLVLTFSYRLDEKGLTISLLKIKPLFEKKNASGSFTPLSISNDWIFGWWIQQRIQSINIRSRDGAYAMWADSIGMNGILELVKKHTPEIIGKGVTIDSSDITNVLSWNAATGVIGLDKDLLQVYGEAQKLRTFVALKAQELEQIVSIAKAFLGLKKSYGMDLHFPTIMGDSEHLFTFKRLMPFHLIGRDRPRGGKIKPEDIRPIEALEPLNGNMLGLTGQNAGGKTATQEQYLFTIFDAQSGFPIIGGEEVKLNVKNTIGMVFMERGEGSTLELMLKKTGFVIEVALQHPRNGTLVILDELGTGTQESRGAIIGERILEKLHQAGCSVVFSTQIEQLARRAEQKFGAQCFAFDINHNVRRGIGEGNPELIAKELGLDKLLGIESN